VAVFKRGAKYGAKVYDEHGKQRWLGTFAKRADAKAAVRRAEAEVEERRRTLAHGVPEPEAVETCDSFATRWLADYCSHLSRATLHTYGYVAKAVAADFAGVPMGGIDRPTARRWCLAQPRNSVNVVRTMFNQVTSRSVV
jgi:hypothetical protein